MLLAGIEDGDDVRVVQPAGGFRLAEEALLHVGQFLFVEFLRQRHGLDRDHAVDLGVTAQIDHAHGPLAQFLLDLVAAQHRLLHRAVLEDAGVGAPRPGAAQHDGFRHRLGPLDAGFQILELRIEVGHVTEYGFGLVELPLALEIEGQVVQVFHHRIRQRHLAELVPGHVELSLPLEGQRQHAVGFGRLLVRLHLAALGHQEALGGQQQVADQQQGRRKHQLQPHQLTGHQHEVGGQQRDEQRRRHAGAQPSPQPRQQHDQIEGDQQEHAELGRPGPGRRHEEMFLQDAGQAVRHHLDRGHRRRHRRCVEIADAGRGLADQHDPVAVLVERYLAAHHVEEGIDRERQLAALALVIEAVHAEAGVGRDLQSAQRDRFTELHADVVDAEVQAFCGDQQRQRRIELIEMRHHQRLLTQATVAIDQGIQVANGGGGIAERLDHAGRNVERQWRQQRRRLAGLDILKRHPAHELGQRLVRPALRLAVEEEHGQRHVAGPGDAVRKLAVRIQCDLGFAQHGRESVQRFGGGRRLLAFTFGRRCRGRGTHL